MYAEERRAAIAEESRSAGRVRVADLAARFDVAPETIRRDLDVLESEGVLQRVHGGAIAALADVTVMAAAWSTERDPESLRGVTISMSVQYLAPARSTDLVGVGRVLHRGKSLVHCEVEIETPAGDPVAKAVGTYKIG